MYITPLINQAWGVIKRIRNGEADIIDIANGQILAWMIQDAIEKDQVDDAMPCMTVFLGEQVIREMEEYSHEGVQNN